MDTYFSFQWHLTDACDQRCTHCYIYSNDNNVSIRSMSWEEMKKTLRSCLEMCTSLERTPYFYITGGDPILHHDFWRLLSLLKEHGIRFSIMGNPFHLNDAVCRKMREHGCDRYQLSIDGLQQTHDVIRKPGSFETTFQKIDCIRRAGIKSVLMMTVSAMNMNELPQVIDTVVGYNVDVFAFARYCPTSSSADTHIDPEEYKQLLSSCWQKFEEHKDSGTLFNLKDHLWTLFLYENGLFKISENLDQGIIYDGCGCGISHLTILPDGDVYACRRMKSCIGNIFRESLADIFLGNRITPFREYKKFEKCSKCELLRFCRGCPAVAFGYTGSHYSSDPQCWKYIE